jgi:hypothetical protein
MNDLLVFLVLAGIALIFRWLTGQGSEDAEKPESPSPNERPQRPPAESEEERVRRFLEALGVPPGSAPPPPVRPRPTTARRVVTPSQPKAPPKVKRSWVQPLPPLVTTPKEVPAPAPPPVMSAPPPPVVVAVPSAPAPVALPALRPTAVSPRMAMSGATQAAPPLATGALGSLGAILRTPVSVRQAILLREILGPPRGLQALDELRSF